MPSSEIMFWKITLHTYVHIYACIYIYIYIRENGLTKTIFEIGIEIASVFSGMALNAFWKRALHIYIYIYIYKMRVQHNTGISITAELSLNPCTSQVQGSPLNYNVL